MNNGDMLLFFYEVGIVDMNYITNISGVDYVIGISTDLCLVHFMV